MVCSKLQAAACTAVNFTKRFNVYGSFLSCLSGSEHAP